MTSSTAGDRSRWSTARRSGMTILGKIAVPKPINLPSQRLENQGLDPNVEIVPKGTLSWGSKSSLNAWGSSPLSPRNESGGSASHLSNRSSSGGTCTRPSTAGSDRAHESSANAWNSNSRPSSASGVLPSNQVGPLRPNSAETRPGSSQLSRFAEAAPENSAVWGQHTAEKLGVDPVKNYGFSLTSGDFPSLGAEKESSGKSAGPQDHGPHVCPGSSFGRSTTAEEQDGFPADANVRSGEVNTWRRDHQPYGEDGPRHFIEERQMDTRGLQPYPNANFPSPHHFDSWRGPPMGNHPGGVWYRGSPPPYGPPVGVGPGGFPMDPFPYYPQVPAAPGHGTGPRGDHSAHGDMYTPPMPDSYVRPGMPIRPGFYPGPVPYEGYYGPPMGHYNPHNQDMPFVGMPLGPYGYNKHSGPGGFGPTGRPLASEQVEPDHSQERGPYKVLLKPQEGWLGSSRNNEVKQSSSSNCDRKAEVRNDRNMESRRIFVSSETSSQTWEGGSFDTVKSKLHDEQVLLEAGGDIQTSKEENVAPGDPSLSKKIEGLNAKTRTGDGRQHASSSVSSSDDEQGSKRRTISSESSVKKVSTRNTRTVQDNDSKGRGFYGTGDQAAIRNPEQAAISRKPAHGTQGKADHQSKGRVINEDSDGWRKKAAVSGSSRAISSTNPENFAKAHMGDPLNTDSKHKPVPDPLWKKEGETLSTDSSDSQRFRMRELAMQRALQRQKEEEERARDQRAKAHSKLEELNRRTQVEEDSAKSVEAASCATEDPESLSTALLPSSFNLVAGHAVQPFLEAKTTFGDEIYEEPTGEIRKSDVQEVTTLTEDVINADPIQMDNFSRVHDGGALKQNRVGYKQKQNVVFKKKVAGNSHATDTREAVVGVPSPDVVNEGVLSCNTDTLARSSMTTESTYPKRKNNRNGKKKLRVEETTTDGSTSGHVGEETKSKDESIETGKEKVAEMQLGSDSVPCQMDSKESGDPAECITSLANEGAGGRAKNLWKSQHSGRPQRNSQGNKLAEKFHGTDAVVWAPVRAQQKADTPVEANQKCVAESVSSAKSGQQVQNNSKSKRVEMERYVPKPIAKEMAEQSVSEKEVAAPETPENAQNENSGSEGTETLHHSDSAMEKSGSVSESRHGNGRQNKHGRVRGSWRPRGPVGSTKALEDGQIVNSDQNVQRTVNYHQPTKKDIGFVREQTTSHDDEWGDGWNMIPENLNSTATAPQAVAIGKDQMTIHNMQQTFRGNKGGGSNYGDNKKANRRVSNRGYVQHLGSGASQPDSPGASKENHGTGGDQSSSQWQPKKQTPISSDQKADKFGGSESTRVEAGRANEKDTPGDGQQGFTREWRTTPPDRHARSQSQAPTNKDVHLEQNSNSGFPKNTNQFRHYGRGHDSRGDWGSAAQDDLHRQKPFSSRDRPRQNSHYKYQPVGNAGQAKESSQTSGPRYKEKVHGYQRHGGERLYEQHRGNVRRDEL
ncbi:PREDICTED: protein MODIFIER OF SNC1 1-like [Tarenaya hassleriana]|uniref:protein MODIFIER OF SNC1 1-like n=1 Tax=Tarenaya hassleriana TaxID=28532 RepID=UPI00053C6600|nr:PREDICTED: protein MODIFIER OF SNC1 1-like [Tarenaya hassleriana]